MRRPTSKWSWGDEEAERPSVGLPVAQTVKNPPAGARDVGLIPDPGRCRMHGAAEPVQTTSGPHAPELVVGNMSRLFTETPAHHSHGAASATREQPAQPKVNTVFLIKESPIAREASTSGREREGVDGRRVGAASSPDSRLPFRPGQGHLSSEPGRQG